MNKKNNKYFSILSYNVGHFYLFKFWRHIKLWKNNKVFFLKKDTPQIKSITKKTNPDIIFFQELTSENDAKFLADKLWFKYSSFCKSSHLKWENLGTGILHNFEKATIKIEQNLVSIQSLYIEEYIFTNIHLTPLSKQIRSKQIEEIMNYTKKHQTKKHVIVWDFNIKKRKYWWLNQVDKQSYKTITKIFNDATKLIRLTNTFWFKFDYIFVSKKINITQIDCIKKINKYMDHYPISWIIKI